MSLWVKASFSYSNFRHHWTSGVDTDFNKRVPHAQKGKTTDFSPHLTPFLCSCCLHVQISILSLFDKEPLTGQQIKGYVGISAVVVWKEVLRGEEEKWWKLLSIAGFTLDLIVILLVSHSPKHPLQHFQSQWLWLWRSDNCPTFATLSDKCNFLTQSQNVFFWHKCKMNFSLFCFCLLHDFFFSP